MTQPPTPDQPTQPQSGPPQAVPPQGPPQGAPQAYPQPGYPPQQGYPPQPGAPAQQPGYPQQQGFAQQGYQQQPQAPYAPQGYPQQQGYQQGYGGAPAQPPPGGKSPTTLIMIVIGAVALLAIAGGVFLALGNRGTPEAPPVTPTPAPTVVPTNAPTEQPTEQPTTAPTEQPTTAPTTAPPNPNPGAIDLGSGIILIVPEGWVVQEQVPGAASLTDNNALFVVRTLQAEKNTNPGQLCQQFHQAILKDAPNAKFGDSKVEDVGTDAVSVASCPAAYTETQGGQSVQMAVVTFASVRASDGITFLATILFTEATPQKSFDDLNIMLNGLLNSQIQG